MIDERILADSLTERFGFDVNVSSDQSSDGLLITIIPADIEQTIAFRIELLLGWRSITARFIPGNFASDLMKKMNDSTIEQRAAFAVFAGSLKAKGAEIDLQFDGQSYDSEVYNNWPIWKSVIITMKKIGVVLENNNDYDFQAAFPWLTGFLGLSLALLPLEPVYINKDELASRVAEDGRELYVNIKKYERSHINRAACIEIHGETCKICGFNFEKSYGELGRGFIHVHHIVPVSQMGGSYVINPGTDLIPVCPNCHAMIHRRSNPSDLDTIKSFFTKK